MNNWFSQLNARERTIVIILAILIAFTLLYLVLIEPVQKQRINAEQQLQSEQALLEYMQKSAKRIVQQKGTGQSRIHGNNATPFILVDQSRKQFALPAPDRMTPKGQNSIKFRYNKVAFDRLMQLVQHLQQQGMVLRQIHVNRIEQQPGIVSCRIEMVKP